MKLHPLTDKVLVQPKVAQEKTAGGIYLPEQAQEKVTEGKVIAVGPGKDGKTLPLKEGDNVFFESFAGTEIKIDGKKHLIMDVKDILATF